MWKTYQHLTNKGQIAQLLVVLLWKSWNDSICVDSTIINFDFLGMNELIY